jgi:CRISPR-associated endoribonuclease Cas6
VRQEPSLYATFFELLPKKNTSLPATSGPLTQALFLNLVRQFDPALSARLHDEPRYRPYTVSALTGGIRMGERIVLHRGQPCHLRITLLDGGTLWRSLQMHFLQAGPVHLLLGGTGFHLTGILTTPHTALTRWAGSTDWQTLRTLAARRTMTMHFSSPTAFSPNKRQFGLYPEPILVWGSLVRDWNSYAPDDMKMDKQLIHVAVREHIAVTACMLHTEFLHFSGYVQKGFVGHCSYHVSADEPLAAQLTTLASFALYSGVGYKTTMGMGQVRAEFGTPSRPTGEQNHNQLPVSSL